MAQGPIGQRNQAALCKPTERGICIRLGKTQTGFQRNIGRRAKRKRLPLFYPTWGRTFKFKDRQDAGARKALRRQRKRGAWRETRDAFPASLRGMKGEAPTVRRRICVWDKGANFLILIFRSPPDRWSVQEGKMFFAAAEMSSALEERRKQYEF